ncbi:hypothetical protein EYF80_040021 [Liparis tanakae]|uniref:Uncharacterized protein n=1 Tax=Liparis tanakae TaxID=230148 RepID=A0A4Z2G8D1_9TELE|nr:hypothetical protein EYF80_040021 [Liparis tanakae]
MLRCALTRVRASSTSSASSASSLEPGASCVPATQTETPIHAAGDLSPHRSVSPGESPVATCLSCKCERHQCRCVANWLPGVGLFCQRNQKRMWRP